MQISLLIQTRRLFFTGENTILWILDPYLSQKQQFEVKNMDLIITNTQLFTSPDINCWTGVVWITCGLLWCISCLDSHSDGTHSLQRIHWWACDVMLHFSKSDEETNSSTSWKVWGWVQFQRIFIFGWTSPMIFITQLNWWWWALIAAQERAAQGRTV